MRRTILALLLLTGCADAATGPRPAFLPAATDSTVTDSLIFYGKPCTLYVNTDGTVVRRSCPEAPAR